MRILGTLLVLALSGASRAQEPQIPAWLESFVRDAPPMVILEDDAARAVGERTYPPAPAEPPAPRSGVSHTITLDPPPVVNRSSQCVFRDVTERPAIESRVRSIEERRATVEMLRQSLARPGKK